MAISLTQRAGGILPLPQENNGASTTNLSFGSQPGAGNFVAVFISENKGAGTLGVTNVTDNQGGGNYAQGITIAAGSAGACWIYYRENITSSGTWTVTVNMKGTTFFDVGIAEFSGVATSSSAGPT